MRDALACLTDITVPGTIVALDYTWPTPWKDEARELGDHRSERAPTPQYQTDDDRDAAVARYGEEVACSLCVPATVPAD